MVVSGDAGGATYNATEQWGTGSGKLTAATQGEKVAQGEMGHRTLPKGFRMGLIRI